MMRLQDYVSLAALFAATGVGGGLAACGGAVAAAPSGSHDSGVIVPPSLDAGTPPVHEAGAPDAAPDVDHGAPSTTYPAFTPDVGQITNNGGPVLPNPQIVTVTWSSDPNASYFEAFGDTIGASKYWAAAVTQYGVGAPTSGAANHVNITTSPPTNFVDTDLANYVAMNAQDTATSMWPAPNANVVYVVYLAPTTSLTFQGADACSQGIGGYHDNVTAGSQNVAYAVVLQCSQLAGPQGPLAEVTQAASHEIVEASTDPNPNGNPAWLGFDDNDHLSWDVFQQFQDEVADACELYFSSFYIDNETAFPYGVQRIWSNSSILAGHNPCVPLDGDVYYNVTLLEPEDITVNLTEFQGPATFATKGIHILPGQSKTFPIGYYSDGPTSGPWTITLNEGNPLFGPQQGDGSNIAMSVDVPQGVNGDKAYVTVTVTTAGQMGAELISIQSNLGQGEGHWMPILIGSQ
jgi:hypothetical protein